MGGSEIESKSLGGEVGVSIVGGAAQLSGGSEIESKSLGGEVMFSIVGGAAQHSAGSEIESNEPVRKKPKLHQDEDEDEDPSDDDESIGEDDIEFERNFQKTLDLSTHIPAFFQMKEIIHSDETKHDNKLEEIRRKIAVLKSTGFKGISFTARCISDAYEFLHIFSDPEGFKVLYEDMQCCTDYGECISYITLLKKLIDSGIASAEKFVLNRFVLRHELAKDHSLSPKQRRHCMVVLSDHFEIYKHVELVEKCESLQKRLLESKSKENYLKNPACFKKMLWEDYCFIGDYHFDYVFEAFAKWWTSDPEKDDGKSARMSIDNLCAKFSELRCSRLRRLWTKGDYMKLKLDVAWILGIYEVPDELASFVLPGHFRRSSSNAVFEPVS